MLLAYAICGTAPAQERATVRGTVVDSTGTPIWGAKIEYRSEAGIQLAGTDEKGVFAVEEAPAGGTLVVSFPGFATVTREIKAHTAGGSVQFVFTQSPNRERIEVTTTVGVFIPATPKSRYQISAEAIDNS